MYLDAVGKTKIIKSTKSKGELTFKEVVHKECEDSEEVILHLKALQKSFEENPAYELLHGLKDRMSICFRDKLTEEEICFYASD